MKIMQVLLASAIVVCLPKIGGAQNFNQLIVFGGSTADTGWFANAKLSPVPNDFDPGVASSLAAGGNAHFTGPGSNNAQILGGFFGLSANSANTPGGTNYAIGGAFDHAGPGDFAAWTNNELLSRSLPPNPSLPTTTGQINNYLTAVNGKANLNALYLISSGGNDIFISGRLDLPSAVATAYFHSEAQALVNSVAQLQAAGARYIMVPNDYGTPGMTPTDIAFGKTLFGGTWSDLASVGVKFIPADTASVVAAVEQNPAAFGITHDPTAVGPTAYACLPPLGSQSTTAHGIFCAPTTTPSATHAYLQSPDATRTYLFVDGIHLTQAGQIIVADYYYNLLTAPSQVSFLAESTIQTTFGMMYGIQQQIELSQRQAAGWNVWINGDLSYLQIHNSLSGIPDDPGVPISGSLGVDYHWANGWLVGGAVTAGFLNSTFSTGGGFTQNEGALSLYAAFHNREWWANLIGSVSWLNFTTNRPVSIGITVQPNDGSTSGTDLSSAGEGGYEFHAGPFAHGPVAGFIVQQAMVNGFTESGSFTSLSFGKQLLNSDVSLLGYQANMYAGMWHPFAQVVWDHDFAPLSRAVNASLNTIAAPGYSLPAVIAGRDWATATIGTEFKIVGSWTGLASFTAQLGQQNVTNYIGLLGINYAFGQPPPPPIVYKN